ncbi:MAG TPA: hypothetical protein EYG68_00220 [Leucothrix mucor]|nr:hypothetical protein [Leucothrix mucor]
MNKIRFITLLIVGMMILSLQGCSLWKRDQIFNFWQKKEIIPPAKNFSYNFQEPARKNLTGERIRSLRLQSPKLRRIDKSPPPEQSSKQYYSANGNVCRMIDASGAEVVCAVSGRWQASPSILANSVNR